MVISLLVLICDSYLLDVNMDRVEDVLLHQKLLIQAKEPGKRPVFHVRFLEVLHSSHPNCLSRSFPYLIFLVKKHNLCACACDLGVRECWNRVPCMSIKIE